MSRMISVHREALPDGEPEDLGSLGEDLAHQPEGFRPTSTSAAPEDVRSDAEMDDVRNYPERSERGDVHARSQVDIEHQRGVQHVLVLLSFGLSSLQGREETEMTEPYTALVLGRRTRGRGMRGLARCVVGGPARDRQRRKRLAQRSR